MYILVSEHRSANTRARPCKFHDFTMPAWSSGGWGSIELVCLTSDRQAAVAPIPSQQTQPPWGPPITGKCSHHVVCTSCNEHGHRTLLIPHVYSSGRSRSTAMPDANKQVSKHLPLAEVQGPVSPSKLIGHDHKNMKSQEHPLPKTPSKWPRK